VKRDAQQPNAITIECDGDDIFHARFTGEELCEQWEHALCAAAAAAPLVDMKPNFAQMDSIFQSA